MIRARLRLLLFIQLVRFGLAIAVAWPFAAAFSATVSNLPRGDALLFDAGGMFLLEALRIHGSLLQASLWGSCWALMLASLLNVGLVALAVQSLDARPDAPTRALVIRALSLWPRFLLLGGVTLLAQVLLAFVALLLVKLTALLFGAHLNEHQLTLACAVTALVGLVPVCALSIVQDLARVALVRHASPLWTGLALGVESLRDDGRTLTRTWLGVSLLIFGVVIFAGEIVGALHVEREGAWRVLLALLIHWFAALLAFLCRLYWLGRALRMVRPLGPSALDGRSANTAAPADPTPDPVS